MTICIPVYDGSKHVVAQAEIDDEDLPLVEQFRWWRSSTGYAVTWVRWLSKRHKEVYMHRLLYGQALPVEVDHMDGNCLNNRRSNLRGCDHQHNSRNKGLSRRNKSGVTGVYQRFGRWRANIRVCGKLKHIGIFATVEEATQARLDAEVAHFGEFRRAHAQARIHSAACALDVSCAQT